MPERRQSGRAVQERFLVERTLGRGGMATVYLARDRRLDRSVALKVLAEHLAEDDVFRDRFLREARLAARLVHPNVVQVYDVGENGSGPYIVMEYVEGDTLADELARRGRLPPEEVVAIGIQLCSALEAAHAERLVHRDIKPQNILCRPDGHVKLADFGIARSLAATHHTEIGTVLGTAAYLAPEQARGEQVTAAADIYSLGVVLYELLTGQTPIEAQTLSELVLKREQGAIVPPSELVPEIPDALEAVVMRCLALRPEFRPASAALLARELAASIDEPVTEALPPALGIRATEVLPATTAPLRATRIAGPLNRRRLLVGLIAAAVLAGLALALAFADPGDKRAATTTTTTTHRAKPAATKTVAKTTPAKLAAARAPTGPTALAALTRNVASAVSTGALDPGTGQAIVGQAQRAVSDDAAGGPAPAANDLRQAEFALAAADMGRRATQAEASTLQADLSTLATALGVSAAGTQALTQPGPAPLPGPAGGPGHGHGFGHGPHH